MSKIFEGGDRPGVAVGRVKLLYENGMAEFKGLEVVHSEWPTFFMQAECTLRMKIRME